MKPQKLSGARIVVRELISQDVDVVFGYPGGQVLELYDALYEKRRQIRHVLTAHEQGAAHAADGYARASGRVGVVIATSGPGAANLVTGIATAYLDSIPLVAITGNVDTTQIGRDSFQELDIADITMPITKHNYIVKDVTKLAETVREAFEIAREGRPGPVLIDIPRDVQRAKCLYAPAEASAKQHPTRLDEAALDFAAELIESAERPLIYCGGGCVSANAGALALELAERLDAPIGCSLMGLSAIPDGNPRKLGLTGMHGLPRATYAVSRADVIIAVGARFTDRATGARGELVGGARIVQLDIDPAEIDKNVTDAAYLVGELPTLLAELTKRLTARQNPAWREEIVSRPELTIPESESLTPFEIIDAASEVFPGVTVATDVGQHQMWAAQRVKLTRERSFLTSGGLGTMGFGLGAAIGASIASGNAPILLYTGDGSFGMNLTELATAVSEKLPICVILMNNRSLGMVKQWQNRLYGRLSSSELARATDFVRVAEGFGSSGARATSMTELKRALRAAQVSLARRIPFVIECTIDPEATVASPNPVQNLKGKK